METVTSDNFANPDPCVTIDPTADRAYHDEHIRLAYQPQSPKMTNPSTISLVTVGTDVGQLPGVDRSVTTWNSGYGPRTTFFYALQIDNIRTLGSWG